MCTAITFYNGDHYFGRTLDYERSFGEHVVVTPRNYQFSFDTQYAIIGMAHVTNDYPLYYDGINEVGLGVAGLNFPGNACYNNYQAGMINVASYELIPFLLGRCKNVNEAKKIVEHINITANTFCKELPPTPLHWLVSDKEHSFVIEQTKDGMHVYDNPIGVLTNNPPFESQMYHLSQFINLTSKPADNRFTKEFPLQAYSRGMGAIGLPGDVSSSSRFVRAAFTKSNSVCGRGEKENVNQFFHILGTVEQVRGCVELEKGVYEITIYTSCCNLDKGVYYFSTYNNPSVRHVSMHEYDLKGQDLISFHVDV